MVDSQSITKQMMNCRMWREWRRRMLKKRKVAVRRKQLDTWNKKVLQKFCFWLLLSWIFWHKLCTFPPFQWPVKKKKHPNSTSQMQWTTTPFSLTHWHIGRFDKLALFHFVVKTKWTFTRGWSSFGVALWHKITLIDWSSAFVQVFF